MKIAYVMYPGACFMGKADGIRMQAIVWANEIIKRGHAVDFINPWECYNWKEFDIVHVFSFGLWNYDFIYWGSGLNKNIVISPIIDSNTPHWKYKLATYAGFSKLRMFSQNYVLRSLKPKIKMFFARSEYESDYFRKGYDIEEEKISVVPLSYRKLVDEELSARHYDKEPFCLFVGEMTQERKNVARIIEAAKKYNFKLVLAGDTGNEESIAKLKSQIGKPENIEIKGFVPDAELESLYSRAKVFALPSISEGVGLVALEAAVHECNIVITNLGGPKEYYPDGLAYKVNPYDVDDIGRSIVAALENNEQQPALKEHIMKEYNLSRCVDLLVESYEKVAKAK